MFSKLDSIKLFLLVLSIVLLGACSTATIPKAERLQVDSSTEANVVSQTEPARARTEENTGPPKSQLLNLATNVDVETVASVLDRDDVFLLDVREQSEFDAGHIVGNTLIPTGSITERLAEIPKDKTVIVYCHSGSRSARVTQFLTEQGYTNVHNMQGGIVAWQQAGLAVEQ